MNKYINYIKASVFLIILFALFLIIPSFILPRDNTRRQGLTNFELRTFGYLAERENSIDVLFMGDSVAFNSFEPYIIYKNYGVTSYNIGENSQPIYNAYECLLRFLEYQSPSVIVLETNTLFRDFSWVDALNYSFINNIPLLRWHNRWKTIKFDDLLKKPKFTSHHFAMGGFIRFETHGAANNNYPSKTYEIIDIPDVNQYYVKKIKDLCDKKNIKLLLVSGPCKVYWRYTKHNGVEKFAKENDLKFIDLNLIDDTRINWLTETYDEGDHVNFYGAIRISNYIGKYLTENYELKDHRDDEKYDDWNKGLETFKKRAIDGYNEIGIDFDWDKVS